LWRRTVPVTNDPNPEFDELVGLIANPYEMTCLSLPDKEVQPKETWEAKVPLILSTGKTTRQMVVAKGKKKVMVKRGPAEVVDMVLTCTYEGSRVYQGQNQAVITATGFIQGRGPGINAPSGKIAGTFHFLAQKGYLNMVDLSVRHEGAIPTDDGNDIPIARVLEVKLTRVPGNTAGIVAKLPPPPAPVPKGAQLFQQTFSLTAADKTDCPQKPGCSYKKVDVNFVAGKIYVIEMDKTDKSFLDPFLLLQNPRGKIVASDDDRGGDLNARIIFKVGQTGTFSIYATTLEPRMYGAFRLTVSERAKQ